MRPSMFAALGLSIALLGACPSKGGGPPAPAPVPTQPDGAAVALAPDAAPAAPPVRGPGILMRGNNLQRLGANLDETILAPASVDGQRFGKLYCRAVDGEIYGQMLYLPNLNLGAKGRHNTLLVVTMTNRVYAFDADSEGEPALWEKSFVDEAAAVTPVPARDVGRACGVYRDISSSIGILSTPAIDAAANTMYFVTRTKEGAGPDLKYLQKLHAVNLLDGSERVGSPVVIEGSLPGSGANAVEGRVRFNPLTNNQRAALMIHDGVVYIAWSSHCDQGPYHGWVLGYDAATLGQVVAYNATPNGRNGGIWMSGAAPAVDEEGFIYLLTGNGDADLGPEGGPNRGHSFLKLRRQGSTLQIADWFTPFNYSVLEAEDRDLGSTGVLLVPGSNIVMGGSKEGKLYLVDRTNMGRYRATDDNQILQTVALTGPRRAHTHGSPVYWKSQEGEFLYVMAEEDYLKQFRIVNGRLQLHKMSVFRAPTDPMAPNTYTMPGGTLTLTADGDKPGSAILWVTLNVSKDANNAVVPGMVRAFDAGDVSKELWNSEANAPRDRVGNFAKFNPATVYNGKVYIPTFSNRYCVYGHLP
jgi:hypothetical protein